MAIELEYPIVLSVRHCFFSRRSGFKFWHFQNGVFDLPHLRMHFGDIGYLTLAKYIGDCLKFSVLIGCNCGDYYDTIA